MTWIQWIVLINETVITIATFYLIGREREIITPQLAVLQFVYYLVILAGLGIIKL